MRRALQSLAALVHRESGMVLREEQLDALAGTLGRIDPGGDPTNFLRRVSEPGTGARLLAALVDEITVKETFFLRHLEQLNEVQWPALLERARAAGSNNVRVWSAACATGEEPYSLALLACEAFGTLDPPVTILATDVSATALVRAREGEYRTRSTRELDASKRQRYFRQEDDRLIVNANLRSVVTFAQHNLVTGAMPPLGEAAFDLILCRNVLIYFDEETVSHVLDRLQSALAPNGVLILGAADALSRSAGRLKALAHETVAEPEPLPLPNRVLRRPLGRVVTGGQSGSPSTDAAQHFLDGLAALEAADPIAAVSSLRRALYADPAFGLAAFQLARSYEALGDLDAARRAYEQTLRTLRADEENLDDTVSEQITLDDIRAAAQIRLEALAAAGFATNARVR
jgi:chemotaxis protein methyltransferase CheR